MLRNIGLWVFLAVLPLWGIASVLEPESNIIENNISLDFELHGGLMLIQASVDGVIGNYLFDSGAPSVVLNQKVHNATTSFISIDGELEAREFMVQELRIGNFSRIDVEAWSMDLSYVEDRLGLEIHGLIGADILASYDVMIDYKNSKLSLINSKNLNTSKLVFSKVVAIPLVSYSNNLPVVEVNLNGDLLRMSFDTGAGVSVLSEDLVHLEQANIDNIQLGLLRIQSLPILGKDMSNFTDMDGHNLDGILSVNALNADRVLISSRKKKIYLFWQEPTQ